MILPSKQFKTILKYLSASKADTFVLDTIRGQAVAHDKEITVVVESELLKARETFEQHILTTSFRRFSAIVSKMVGDITVTPEEKILRISGKSKATLEVFKGRPLAAVPETGQVLRLPLAKVQTAMRFALIAAEPNRAAQHGGVVEMKSKPTGKGTAFQFTGTDGHRMHLGAAEPGGEEQLATTMLLPIPLVQTLSVFTAPQVDVIETPTMFIVQAEEESARVTIRASRLTKTYPDCESVVPKGFDFLATLDPAEVKSVFDSVSPMVGEEVSGVKDDGAVWFTFAGQRLTVRSYGHQNCAEDYTAADIPGSISDDPLDDMLPPERTFSLNLGMVSDFISSAKDRVTFQGNSDPRALVVLTCGGNRLVLSPTVVAKK